MRILSKLIMPLAVSMLFCTGAQAQNTISYNGFLDRDALVESSVDKGLVVEMVIRCDRVNNKVTAGIMSYSKVDRMFCASTNKCFKDSEKAVEHTCGV